MASSRSTPTAASATRPNSDYEGTDTFTYKVSDGHGGTAEARRSIIDRRFRAEGRRRSVKVADTAHKTIDLVIILDRSGSMNDPSGVPGVSTRLELARAAIAALFEAYQSVADLHIQIVDFADSAASSGWLATPEAANAYLAGLTAGGGTNYTAAIDTAMSGLCGRADGRQDRGLLPVRRRADRGPGPHRRQDRPVGRLPRPPTMSTRRSPSASAAGITPAIPISPPSPIRTATPTTPSSSPSRAS